MKFINLHGYEDTHEISPEGVVRSKPHATTPGKELRPYTDRYGYKIVAISSGGKVKAHKLHRLLLSTFVRPPKPGEEGRHLDGNRANNDLNNLAWGSRLDNEGDKKRHGTHANKVKDRDPRGHLYEGANLAIQKDGSRRCRACARANLFVINQRKKGEDYSRLKKEISDFYYENGDRRFILANEVKEAIQ